ncbi:hypothetical protein QR680_016203 [Steinernema hermaphroditum]|uniref:Uncharacterized protein n=1 Tax=Steinernema hermaphroditum TaxID=289476 RepID=A0AA39HBH9_9BILA|nr:hypothetical protein QR680_016203 [Steinernema hermaphroditum]
MIFPVIFLFGVLVKETLCVTGLDAIQRVTGKTFRCLIQNDFKFFIARVWESVGKIDIVGIENIKSARQSGVQYADGYIFPCLRPGCAPAKNQVEATVNRLREDKAEIGMLWMDIEILEWPSNKEENRRFIEDMVTQAEAMKVKVGIYSNNNNWEKIVGLDWTAMSKYPLWWTNDNGEANFNGFQPFGPCGVEINLNWYP